MNLWTQDNTPVETYRRTEYASDAKRWPDGARYQADGYRGIAWFVLGWAVEHTEDTEWDGIVNTTDRVLAVMVDDDRPEAFDPDDLTPIGELDYCAECGQIGCCHDGRSRD